MENYILYGRDDATTVENTGMYPFDNLYFYIRVVY